MRGEVVGVTSNPGEGSQQSAETLPWASERF